AVQLHSDWSYTLAIRIHLLFIKLQSATESLSDAGDGAAFVGPGAASVPAACLSSAWVDPVHASTLFCVRAFPGHSRVRRLLRLVNELERSRRSGNLSSSSGRSVRTCL